MTRASEFAKLLEHTGEGSAALGKPAEALACFQECLTLNPWDALAYQNIGSLHASNGSLAEAIKFFRLLLSIDLDYVGSYHYLGDALVEKEDHKAAVASFERALNLDPRVAQVYWDCALALHLEGKNDSALEHVKSVLCYAPTDPPRFGFTKEGPSHCREQ